MINSASVGMNAPSWERVNGDVIGDRSAGENRTLVCSLAHYSAHEKVVTVCQVLRLCWITVQQVKCVVVYSALWVEITWNRHIENWAIRSSVRSFARTAHSFACPALLALLARSAGFIRLLACSLTY